MHAGGTFYSPRCDLLGTEGPCGMAITMDDQHIVEPYVETMVVMATRGLSEQPPRRSGP